MFFTETGSEYQAQLFPFLFHSCLHFSLRGLWLRWRLKERVSTWSTGGTGNFSTSTRSSRPGTLQKTWPNWAQTPASCLLFQVCVWVCTVDCQWHARCKISCRSNMRLLVSGCWQIGCYALWSLSKSFQACLVLGLCQQSQLLIFSLAKLLFWIAWYVLWFPPWQKWPT